MPVIVDSKYNPSFLLKSGHFQTIWPTLTRHVQKIQYYRERIDTPDGDFLDLDWAITGSKKLTILLHGLEGSSGTHYMQGMATAFQAKNWNVLAMNLRGCSGTPNKLIRSYHSGATEDLVTVMNHVLHLDRYNLVVIIGFSLGGNLLLKCLGEQGPELPEIVKAGVAISVPCDLAGSAQQISKTQNYLYEKRFLIRLRRKIKVKVRMFPDLLEYEKFREPRSLREFDDLYTAPVHGFRNAADYYTQCSSRQFIPQIRCPVLILNAANDPFLSKSCYPFAEAKSNPLITLEVPKSGGHVGFIDYHTNNRYWHEQRTIEFVKTSQE